MFSEIVKRRIKGIIHAACSSKLSRYEQGMKIAEVFELNTELIIKSSSDAMNWIAPRPRNSTLSVDKATELLNYKPRSYDESVRDFYLEFHHEKQ
jgi:dTDP-4-dehydrorhamnose reductase